MAGSLKTAFFNLVKYAANDITTWLTDFNGNMDKIDTAMNQNKTAAQTAQDGVDNLEAEYESLLTVVNEHTTSIDANEKAIAANSASIEEMGNEISGITIGEQISFTTNDVTKVEPLITTLNLCGRRIGNYFSGAFLIYHLNKGTLHSYDRMGTGIVEGKYLTDLIRVSGNPFNLPDNVYTYLRGVRTPNTDYGSYLMSIAIAYLPDSNFTVVCDVEETASPLVQTEESANIFTVA